MFAQCSCYVHTTSNTPTPGHPSTADDDIGRHVFRALHLVTTTLTCSDAGLFVTKRVVVHKCIQVHMYHIIQYTTELLRPLTCHTHYY